MSRRRAALTERARPIRRERRKNQPATSRPTPKKSSPAPRQRSLARRLVVLVVLTALVLGGQQVMRSSFFRVRHVTFVGLHHETSSQALRASGLFARPLLWTLQGSSVARHLEDHFSWIREARIEKHWPNAVVVYVVEATPVAVAYDATHQLRYVDERGRNLGPAPRNADLPTLTYQHPTTSSWPFARAGRAAAIVAAQLPAAFARQVALVSADAHGYVTLSLTTPVSFELGPATNLHAKFTAIASVIAHVTLTPGSLIDVRVPDELALTRPGATTTTVTSTTTTTVPKSATSRPTG